MKNLDTVLREKEQQVELLQTEIEALRLVSLLLKDEAAATEITPRTASSSLAAAPAPTHVMQGSSSGSFDREPGGYLGAASGLKQFP